MHRLKEIKSGKAPVFRLCFIALGVSLLLCGCGHADRKDVSDYYYPLEELRDGRVYEYATVDLDKKTPLYSSYSYMRYMETDSNALVITNTYTPKFFNDQYVLEEVVGNGVLALEYQLMSPVPGVDTPHIERAKIVDDNAFPFLVKMDGGVTAMQIEWTDPNDDKEHIRLVRERQYRGDTTYTYKGEDRPAVIFSCNELHEYTHEDKGDFDNTIHATEIYAKGLGLVSRKYKIGEARMERVLLDTFGMKRLENLARQYWDEQ